MEPNSLSNPAPQQTTQTPVLPKDARIIQGILNSMGIYEYEPRVVNQLLDFMYRYVSDIVEDAQKISAHKDSHELDIEDIKQSIQSKVNVSFTQPPPKEVLQELASKRNSKILRIPDKDTVILPPKNERFVTKKIKSENQNE